jgi:hypothetical protein
MEKVQNIDIGVTDFGKLTKFALENDVGLVVPGPEIPLVAGIESHFRKGNISVYPSHGPSWDRLFWTDSKGCQNGGVESIFKSIYGTAQYPNSQI